MDWRRALVVGIVAGLVMGICLFLTGAIASRIVYGPQMAPAGKFEPRQMNALYFIWTKLLIGVVFGLLVSILYERLPLAHRMRGAWHGLTYAFWLWLVIYLWGRSHPWVYEQVDPRNQVFWLVYTLGGFLGFGLTFGSVHRRLTRRSG